ncbi:MAG: STAS domain-containing protein [Azoarcus sp.]|jgi:phospholipid transport system transporter-binding protein|nr:STAS domain-containing protein [Azoarcus sp.]
MAEPATLKLEGALTLHTVAAHLERPLPDGDFTIDLGGIAQADSAALALLLAWLRRAKARGSQVALRALPEPLRALAETYGIAPLLPPPAT